MTKTNSFLSQEKSQALISALQEFGLNPEQWWLKLRGDNQFSIINKNDSQFIFFGQAICIEEQPSWTNVQLISL